MFRQHLFVLNMAVIMILCMETPCRAESIDSINFSIDYETYYDIYGDEDAYSFIFETALDFAEQKEFKEASAALREFFDDDSSLEISSSSITSTSTPDTTHNHNTTPPSETKQRLHRKIHTTHSFTNSDELNQMEEFVFDSINNDILLDTSLYNSYYSSYSNSVKALLTVEPKPNSIFKEINSWIKYSDSRSTGQTQYKYLFLELGSDIYSKTFNDHVTLHGSVRGDKRVDKASSYDYRLESSVEADLSYTFSPHDLEYKNCVNLTVDQLTYWPDAQFYESFWRYEIIPAFTLGSSDMMNTVSLGGSYMFKDYQNNTADTNSNKKDTHEFGPQLDAVLTVAEKVSLLFFNSLYWTYYPKFKNDITEIYPWRQITGSADVWGTFHPLSWLSLGLNAQYYQVKEWYRNYPLSEVFDTVSCAVEMRSLALKPEITTTVYKKLSLGAFFSYETQNASVQSDDYSDLIYSRLFDKIYSSYAPGILFSLNLEKITIEYTGEYRKENIENESMLVGWDNIQLSNEIYFRWYPLSWLTIRSRNDYSFFKYVTIEKDHWNSWLYASMWIDMSF